MKLEKEVASIAKEAHAGQLYGKKPYYETHILDVISRAKRKGLGAINILLCYLHDVFEDCRASSREDFKNRIFRLFENTFGEDTACQFMICLGFLNRNEFETIRGLHTRYGIYEDYIKNIIEAQNYNDFKDMNIVKVKICDVESNLAACIKDVKLLLNPSYDKLQKEAKIDRLKSLIKRYENALELLKEGDNNGS